MNWQKELEARLADDPRLERKKSRSLGSDAFFFDGKEIANFPRAEAVSLKMGAAGIFAMGPKTAEDCVLEVGAEWILIRLECEDDLSFTQELLERIFRGKKNVRLPKGKQTRSGKTGGSKATKAFSDAEALKALREFKAPDQD